ncbi:MAG: metallophosphoesterase [Thermoguttaceae bacterium]
MRHRTGQERGVLFCGLLGAVMLATLPIARVSADDRSDGLPLWTFAWITDIHLDATRLNYTAKAFRYVDEVLKPHLVLITGDNNAQPEPPSNPQKPEPLGLRRQRFLKAFLQKNLKTPYAVIPGDDWPQDFDQMFGPKQYSFDCGGLHFVMLAPDRYFHGKRYEGLSVFEPSTLEWLAKDLERHADQPTLVAIHEPICPPTFLDAPKLRTMLDQRPNVFLVLQGHMHVDMEQRRHGTEYLVGPSLGKPPTLAMKWVNVYSDHLVVRTIAYQKKDDQFHMLSQRQKIDVPLSLRSRLVAPKPGRFTMDHYDAVPAHPLVEDPTLANRAGELMKNAAGFLFFSK